MLNVANLTLLQHVDEIEPSLTLAFPVPAFPSPMRIFILQTSVSIFDCQVDPDVANNNDKNRQEKSCNVQESPSYY